MLISFTVLHVNLESVSAVMVGQVDDFDDGTEQNWMWGRSGFGGPVAQTGSFDGSVFLQTESFGGGDAPGSRLVLINREQWTGDYIANGIGLIAFDAINEGPNFAFDGIAGSDVTEVLSSVSELRILSSEDPDFLGDQFIARLGLDNITAIAVPEPGAMVLLLAGMVCGFRRRRRV